MKWIDNAVGGWLKEVFRDPAFYITLVASALIAFLGDIEVLGSVKVNVGSALVQMSGALLGIILAGLAIFVVFLDKKYVALIERVFTIESELGPFKLTALIAIFCLLFGMGLILIGEPNNLLLRFIIWGALWSFLYLLWQIYELVKFLIEHAKNRVMQIRQDDGENGDESK
jgi:hypothetical protein